MDRIQNRKHCPFVRSPLDECFVININSQNIEQAIYYCSENFEECEIYKREIKKNEEASE